MGNFGAKLAMRWQQTQVNTLSHEWKCRAKTPDVKSSKGKLPRLQCEYCTVFSSGLASRYVMV
jgi:hypothetical protein